MKKITIFDTSVVSDNIGDFIIMDAVNRELKTLFKECMFFYSLTHDKISKASYKLNKISDYSFIGGTNLLSSNMNSYNQWKINLFDSFFLKNIILMGVGWWQYQKQPNIYTKILYRSVLHKQILHSVRDSYTEKMMKSMGFNNVINTACPTMWGLNKEHCHDVPAKKAEDVVITVTDYNKDYENDKNTILLLRKNYRNIYFWPQGSGDLDYAKQIGVQENEVLPPNLYHLESLLKDPEISLDYVGTRLHAGIMSLQRKRRSIIIGIDNRSTEKAKDFNLPVVSRDHLDSLHKKINSRLVMDIFIPEDNIFRWKQQFL